MKNELFKEEIVPDIIIAENRYYTRKKLAKLLKKSEQTIAGWRSRRFGPAFIIIGKKCLYPEDELLKWLHSRTFNPEKQ
jgi:helix-turn-helix protein